MLSSESILERHHQQLDRANHSVHYYDQQLYSEEYHKQILFTSKNDDAATTNFNNLAKLPKNRDENKGSFTFASEQLKEPSMITSSYGGSASCNADMMITQQPTKFAAQVAAAAAAGTIAVDNDTDTIENSVAHTVVGSRTILSHAAEALNKAMNSNNNKIITSHPSAEIEGFLRTCVDEIIKTAVFEGTERSNKVVEWHSPQELMQLIDLRVKDQGETHAKLLDLMKSVIKYSVKTGHPYFINQLYCGVDPYALIGQWLTDSLNPSVYTYEVAPVFTLMEEEVLAQMRRIVGFANNGCGDGIFCPGGSVANGYAISCARYHKFPNVKKTGLFTQKRQIIFTSEDAHYSVEKLAVFMGLGSDSVCKVKTDKLGKIDISELKQQIEKHIKEQNEPLMISATAGTTVLGAFDDINALADLCQKHQMWLHVDAAWGGGALMSGKYRTLLKGIERADSVTWNPHKMLTASQQCSTFLTSHKELLKQCNSTNATYLFQKDKFYDTSYDTGDKHIQCGRRADVLKFWFMWKAKGSHGFEQHVNQIFHMAEYLTQEIRRRDGFELVLEQPECTNVCFWYIPKSLRQMERNDDYFRALHQVAPKIKEGMIKKGSMMVTYQPLHSLPNFFRIVLQNSCLTEEDMNYFLNEIETLGN